MTSYDRSMERGRCNAWCPACGCLRLIRDFTGDVQTRKMICKWCARKGVRTSTEYKRMAAHVGR